MKSINSRASSGLTKMLAYARILSPQQVADAPKQGKYSFGDGALRSILLASLAQKSKNEIFGFYSLRSAINNFSIPRLAPHQVFN